MSANTHCDCASRPANTSWTAPTIWPCCHVCCRSRQAQDDSLELSPPPCTPTAPSIRQPAQAHIQKPHALNPFDTALEAGLLPDPQNPGCSSNAAALHARSNFLRNRDRQPRKARLLRLNKKIVFGTFLFIAFCVGLGMLIKRSPSQFVCGRDGEKGPACYVKFEGRRRDIFGEAEEDGIRSPWQCAWVKDEWLCETRPGVEKELGVRVEKCTGLRGERCMWAGTGQMPLPEMKGI